MRFLKLVILSHLQATIQKAIDVSQDVHRDWERRSLEQRSEIFLKAADLVSGKYRMDLLAATMLGQVSMGWRFMLFHFYFT